MNQPTPLETTYPEVVPGALNLNNEHEHANGYVAPVEIGLGSISASDAGKTFTFLSGKAHLSGTYASAKRAIDVFGAAVGLILATPIMALIALAIKLDSRGSIIFIQDRAGLDGAPFKMYKFRTMIDGAEAKLNEVMQERGLTEPVLKIRYDPRVTGVGHFLRRWSLDELPQLVNVLRGEMSLVGPRPEELRVVKLYSPWHRQRLTAIPGITGPMQVSGRANLPLDDRVHIELDYIARASLLEDMKIMAKTVGAVLSGDGSY